MIGRRRSAGRTPRALICAALALAVGGPVASAAPTITIYSGGIFPTASPSVATLGPDGDVWFAQASPATPLARIAADGAVSDVPFTGVAPLPFLAWPTAIAAGADGDVWFVAGTIYRVAPSGAVTSLESSLPAGALPVGIAAGSGGAMWFTDDAGGGAIGRIAADGAVTEFRAGLQPGAAPGDITAGPDGEMWFTDAGPTPRIGSITADGAISEVGGLHGRPLQIAAGPDGNLWFTESGPFNGLGRITPAGGLTEFPTGVPVHGIASAEDGRVYFTEPLASTIGAITPAGAITTYSSAAVFPYLEPWDLAVGADGNVWFTDPTVPAAVGRLSVAPIVIVGAGVDVTSDSATVTGEVQGNGQATTYWFQYGTTTGYGDQTAPAGAPSGDGPQPVSGTLDDLSPGTTYHYRLVASNGTGTTLGSDQTLTTTAVGGAADGSTTTTTSAPVAPLATAGSTSTTSTAAVTSTLLSVSSTSTTTSARATRPAGGSASGDAPDGGLLHVSLAPLPATGVRAGHTVAIGVVAGVVYFRVPGSRRRVRLGAHSVVPVGAILDARDGIVKLTAAHSPLAHGGAVATAAARLQTGAFSGGLFVVRQNGTAAHAPVAIVLEGGSAAACTATAHATLLRASAKRPAPRAKRKVSKAGRPHAVVRMLWSKDSGGNFSTHGRDSVGTVQGTLWLTQDRCDGTLTRVVRGRVLVRALFIHHSVLVTAGHAYLAPARG